MCLLNCTVITVPTFIHYALECGYRSFCSVAYKTWIWIRITVYGLSQCPLTGEAKTTVSVYYDYVCVSSIIYVSNDDIKSNSIYYINYDNCQWNKWSECNLTL